MAKEVRSARTLRRHALYGAPVPGVGADESEFPEHAAWPERAQLRLGTSGWSYDHWRGRFYPRALPPRRHLEFFSRRMPTVEVNATYRRLPGPHVFDAWRETAPEGFLFTVKAPGAITHDRRLEGAEAEVDDFLRSAMRLRESLGIVLFQLPSSFHVDLPLLARFLEGLPAGLRYAFELRHRSWFCPETYMLLAEHAAAFVVHDFGRRGSPIVETAPFVYLRLHGPSGRYRGSYDVETLYAWARQVDDWLERGFEVFGYFNNDERAKSVRDVARLRDLVARETLRAPEARAPRSG